MDHSRSVLLTLVLYSAINQGNLLSCDLMEQTVHNQTSMQFSPYKTLENSVVFDWFITLEQKESISHCELQYGAVTENSSLVLLRRTVVLDRLECETEYCITFTCWNKDRAMLLSTPSQVTTGNCSGWLQLAVTRDSQRSSSSDFTFRFTRSSQGRSSVSPHTVLGLCTSILVVSVCVGTTLLVYRKYVRHKDIMAALENEVNSAEEEEENQRVLSISLQCHCQPETETGMDTLEQSLIEF